MYNAKQIEAFIDKVNKEATEAAQKVYDKYNAELIERIQSQIKDSDTIHIGRFGVTIITGYSISRDIECVLERVQGNSVKAAFRLPSNIKKDSAVEN